MDQGEREYPALSFHLREDRYLIPASTITSKWGGKKLRNSYDVYSSEYRVTTGLLTIYHYFTKTVFVLAVPLTQHIMCKPNHNEITPHIFQKVYNSFLKEFFLKEFL